MERGLKLKLVKEGGIKMVEPCRSVRLDVRTLEDFFYVPEIRTICNGGADAAVVSVVARLFRLSVLLFVLLTLLLLARATK